MPRIKLQEIKMTSDRVPTADQLVTFHKDTFPWFHNSKTHQESLKFCEHILRNSVRTYQIYSPNDNDILIGFTNLVQDNKYNDDLNVMNFGIVSWSQRMGHGKNLAKEMCSQETCKLKFEVGAMNADVIEFYDSLKGTIYNFSRCDIVYVRRQQLNHEPQSIFTRFTRYKYTTVGILAASAFCFGYILGTQNYIKTTTKSVL